MQKLLYCLRPEPAGFRPVDWWFNTKLIFVRLQMKFQVSQDSVSQIDVRFVLKLQIGKNPQLTSDFFTSRKDFYRGSFVLRILFPQKIPKKRFWGKPPRPTGQCSQRHPNEFLHRGPTYQLGCSERASGCCFVTRLPWMDSMGPKNPNLGYFHVRRVWCFHRKGSGWILRGTDDFYPPAP